MKMARKTLACAGALATLAAVAPAAHAATLTLYEGNGEWYREGTILEIDYTAGAGEKNDVTAWYDASSRTFKLNDPGATAIVPGVSTSEGTLTKCVFLARSVTCKHDVPPPESWRGAMTFTLDLGDGDDRAKIGANAGQPILIGGDGDDVLRSVGASAVSLDGGAGADTLTGGDGGDRLSGGPGGDRVDGGAGVDEALYPTNLDPDLLGDAGLHVSMDGVAGDGMPGEGDNVLGTIERLRGTTLDDVLIGAAGTQTFLGGQGNDRLEGGGGDDVLDGDAGHDALDGGAGADSLTGDDGSDHLTGGPGGDRVYGQYGSLSTSVTTADADSIDVRDGEADRYACGNDADHVLADPLDLFGYDPPGFTPAHPSECETLEVL